MQRLHKTHCGCPICSGAQHASTDIMAAANAIRTGGKSRTVQRGYATPVDVPREYAFEVAASNLRWVTGRENLLRSTSS